MNTVLISLLQMVISLLITVQGNPNLPIAQRQQALNLASQSLAIARDGLSLSTPTPVSSGGLSVPPVVTPPSTPNTSSTPPIVVTNSDNTVIKNIQNSAWQTCGSCGNSAGNGSLANYQMKTGISTPSLSGSAAEFSIDGHGLAYANGYWYSKKIKPGAPVKYLSYDFDIYVPSSSNGVIQAIEFETQQGINGKVHNFAWQANYSSNQWRTFDYQAKRWVGTSIPFSKFAMDTWHHIQSIYHVDGSGIGYHDSLIIDGHEYGNLNIKYVPSSGTGDYLSNAFQLDSNSKGAPYKVYLDNVSVSYRTK